MSPFGQDFVRFLWGAYAQHEEARRSHRPTMIVWRRLPGPISQDVFEYRRSTLAQKQYEQERLWLAEMRRILGLLIGDRWLQEFPSLRAWMMDRFTDEEVESLWLGLFDQRPTGKAGRS